MRPALNPAAFTLSRSRCVMSGLPHAVSPPVASSVFPMFQPVPIWLATSVAGGSVCASATAGAMAAMTQNRAARFRDDEDGSVLTTSLQQGNGRTPSRQQLVVSTTRRALDRARFQWKRGVGRPSPRSRGAPMVTVATAAKQRRLLSPQSVQQGRLPGVERAPLTPASRVGDRVVGMAVPAGSVAGLRVDRPVAALDALRDREVHERILPLRIAARREVTKAVAIADAGSAARPVEVAAELTHHDGQTRRPEANEAPLPSARGASDPRRLRARVLAAPPGQSRLPPNSPITTANPCALR